MCSKSMCILGYNSQVQFSEISSESRDITVRRSRKIAVFRQMGNQITVLVLSKSHPDISLMVTISVVTFTRDLSCRAQDSLCKSWILYTFSTKSKFWSELWILHHEMKIRYKLTTSKVLKPRILHSNNCKKLSTNWQKKNFFAYRQKTLTFLYSMNLFIFPNTYEFL